MRWLVLALALCGLLYWRSGLAPRYHTAPSIPAPEAEIWKRVGAIVAGRHASLPQPGTVLVLAYREGRLLARTERGANRWDRSLQQAWALTQAKRWERPDAYYFSFGYNYRATQAARLAEFPDGRFGFEFRGRSFHPLEAMTGSSGFEGWYLRRQSRLDRERCYQFEAVEGCMLSGQAPHPLRPDEEITLELLEEMERSLLPHAGPLPERPPLPEADEMAIPDEAHEIALQCLVTPRVSRVKALRKLQFVSSDELAFLPPAQRDGKLGAIRRRPRSLEILVADQGLALLAVREAKKVIASGGSLPRP